LNSAATGEILRIIAPRRPTDACALSTHRSCFRLREALKKEQHLPEKAHPCQCSHSIGEEYLLRSGSQRQVRMQVSEHPLIRLPDWQRLIHSFFRKTASE
jgi:hypothetical protein